MIYTIKSNSKYLNLKRIQLFFTWFYIPIELIPINLKSLIAMIGFNKLAYSIIKLTYNFQYCTSTLGNYLVISTKDDKNLTKIM